MPLTAERLRELFAYDPLTGVFTRRVAVGSAAAGERVGCDNGSGYLVVMIDRHLFYLHRLAWLYCHGEMPTARYLDHENGNRADNRLSNLREATMSQNIANAKRHRDNTSGFKGVSWHAARGRWVAKCRGKYLGLFDTAQEGAAAYAVAAQRSFGDFARAS